MDFGVHPPTIYFPLVVPEALMIEPTETEVKERLDAFVDAMHQIAREAAEDPELLRTAPHTRPVRRLDEVRAAKEPVVKFAFDAASPQRRRDGFCDGTRGALTGRVRIAGVAGAGTWAGMR